MLFGTDKFGLRLAILAILATPPAFAQHHQGQPPHPPKMHSPGPNSGARTNPERNAPKPPPNTSHNFAPNPNQNRFSGGPAKPASNPENFHGGGTVARPPNENLFKPNPKVASPRPGAPGQWNDRGGGSLPAANQQRLRDLSPEEQQRFLRNNQRFQDMTPAQQQKIRQNLQRWNQLSPTEREAYRDREAAFERMTPAQRQHIQSDILPKWQQMPPDRRQLVMGRLHTLQGMSPADRQAALNDPRFMQGLTSEEQSTLRDLNSLRGQAAP
jgi:hypothetical protein